MQSRAMSLLEAVANVVAGVAGFGVAVLTQMLVFPLFGFQSSLDQNLGIGAIFTFVSLVRSYTLQRIFNLFVQRKFQGRSLRP